MKAEVGKPGTGIYQRGQRFRVAWSDGGRQRWASFATHAEAAAFREATRPAPEIGRDPATGQRVPEPHQRVLHCRGCDRHLPRAEFPPRPSRPKGVTSRCRDCLRASARLARAEARAGDPESEREKWNRWSRTPRGESYKRLKVARRRGAFDCEATEAYAEDVLSADPCSYCGGSGGTVDHIDPLSGDGDGSLGNLTGACMDCNRRKSAMPLLAFMLREVDRGR